MEHDLRAQTLVTLLTLRGEGRRCDVGTLASTLGARPSAVAAALIGLEGRGLVDASNVTLTLSGLTAAIGLRTGVRSAKAA